MLPPGPQHLLNTFPSLFGPCIAIGLGFFSLNHFSILRLLTWEIVTLSLVLRPLVFVIRNWVERRAFEREAKANRATLPPIVPESSFAIVGKLTESLKNGYPADAMFEYMQQYGDNVIQFNFFGNRMLFTTEPDHFKSLLATQFDAFEKGPSARDIMDSFLGVGIFNSDGDMWKFHRAITRPFFTKERLSDFEIYARNSDKALNAAQMRLREGFPIDMQDLAGRFTLDSASEYLFGHNVNSISAGIPYPSYAAEKNTPSFYNQPANVFQHAFEEAQLRSAYRIGAGDDWRMFEFWKDEVIPRRQVIDSFTEPIMEEALRKREERVKNGEKEGEESTLLAHLVNQTQDQRIIKDELVNLLVAGRDTTTSLLTFCVYMLIENPDIERRLRKEIFDTVGSHKLPNYEHIRTMRYVRAFMNEVLRLYSPIPVDSRTNKKPAVLRTRSSSKAPLYLPTRTVVLYSPLYMHRRTDLWGPDALTFDPDRFIDERLHKYLLPNPYIFCPFNAGPRICIGQQFAYHQTTFYLVQLLQRFTNFKLAEGVNLKPPESWKKAEGLKAKDKVTLSSAIALSVKGGLWVTMDEFKADGA